MARLAATLSRRFRSKRCRFQSPRLNGRYLSAWHKRLIRALCIVLASSDALAAKSVPVCGPAAGVTTATNPTASAMLCGDSFLSWSEREQLDMDMQGRRG